jgi:nicotinamidase-related amidase
MTNGTMPLPPHFDVDKTDQVYQVPYNRLSETAAEWSKRHQIPPASTDSFRTGLILIDVQNTFCLPDFELFVAGRSGDGAVADNKRLCVFMYQNLHRISQLTMTLDTHQATQIFHANFLIGQDGQQPAPYTLITSEDIRNGTWRFNPNVAPSLGIDPETGQKNLIHYAETLERAGKFDLTIWPYHAMLGGIGHALVSTIEEAIFFHTLTRASQPEFIIKGQHPFTEHYSAVGPEVLTGPAGETLGTRNTAFLNQVIEFDAVIIAGQAKSHCVAWTVADLLEDIQATDPELATKVYLLADCTSPVVVPGADFTDLASDAFQRFAEAGMHLVNTTTPLSEWPGYLDA